MVITCSFPLKGAYSKIRKTCDSLLIVCNINPTITTAYVRIHKYVSLSVGDRSVQQCHSFQGVSETIHEIWSLFMIQRCNKMTAVPMSRYEEIDRYVTWYPLYTCTHSSSPCSCSQRYAHLLHIVNVLSFSSPSCSLLLIILVAASSFR